MSAKKGAKKSAGKKAGKVAAPAALSEAKARALLAKTCDQATADGCKTAAEVVANLASYGIAVTISD